MMVKLTPRQTNLTPRLIPSLLTDHMTPNGFSKRPLSMKGQRWKHIVVEGIGEEEKEEGVRNCEEMKHIYRGGREQKWWERHQYSQKMCNHRPSNIFFVVQTTGQILLVCSEICNSDNTWIPDYIFRKNTIMGCTKGKLGTLCMVRVGSKFIIRIASALDSFVCPTLHRQFLCPQRLNTSINRAPCFH